MTILNSGSLSNTSGNCARERGSAFINGGSMNYEFEDFDQTPNTSSTAMSINANDSGFWFLTFLSPYFSSNNTFLQAGVTFFDRGAGANASYLSYNPNGQTMSFTGLIYLTAAQTATFGTSLGSTFAQNGTGSPPYTIQSPRFMCICRMT